MTTEGIRGHLRVAGAAVAVGLVAGGFAVLFRLAQELVFRHLYGEPNVLRAFAALPWWLRLLLPAAGGAVAASIVAWAHTKRSMNEILEAVAVSGRRISLRTSLVRASASYAALITGGSLGREGPMLHFGATAGSKIGGRARLDPAQTRVLIAAGTAAGFAAAYNTPIAAVLFVAEVVAATISLELALPALAATTISTLVSRWAMGAGPLYGLRGFSLGSRSELFAYAGLGVATGFVGAGFMALLAGGRRFFGRLRVPAAVRGGLGGLAVGALATRFAEVTGNGYETIQLMLDAHYAAPMLALLLLVKAVGTTASVSSGSPGGVFTPSLFLGGAMGGLCGAAARLVWHAPGFPGGFVLCGMAGAIAATTRAPIMASVLGFELSGDYAIVLPLFISTATATIVSRRLHPLSIYAGEASEPPAAGAEDDQTPSSTSERSSA